MHLLTVEDLSVSFPGSVAVRGLSFSVDAGQCVAIVGESGSGKSVTARTLVGLAGDNATVTARNLRLGDKDLRQLSPSQWRSVRGRHIGFVLQDALVSLDPLKTIGSEIAEALTQHVDLSRKEARQKVLDLLASVGIPDPQERVGQYAHQLSGGLRQRALIASAIAADPALLIADEPTTALDVIVQAQVLSLLRDMKAKGTGLILISHDLAVVASLADHIIVLKDGAVVEAGSPDRIFSDPQAPYTRALLAAIPSATTKGRKLTADTPPSTSSDAPGRREDGIALEARALIKRLGSRLAVDHVTLTLRTGETLGLVGASGSGKTTLARLLLGLQQPDRGEVTLRGQSWSGLSERQRRPLRPRIQLVSQDPLGSFDPRYRVMDIIAEALEIAGAPKSDWRARAAELILSVGLSEAHLYRRPRQLSGGQRQRVAIARALAMEPEILICDEPVSALDVSTQAQVLDLLDDLKKQFGLTVLFISHDLGVVHHVSDRVMVMHAGKIVEEGPVDEIFLNPRAAYTRELLAALPRLPTHRPFATHESRNDRTGRDTLSVSA
ncbi:peptide/nickel transport system ATP-binding protein [Microvirga flocculans]|uniref:Peptide/nickel transport system ATP-binding protein n=1 Tax=Microvirga flocculans TaxID=217168 RepID=A0A7W6ICH5_9HYPH|nr:ABC transporter ATP-binding protein [Microvirga flocculans]MBB4038455.1 peptide/nickel transport system ATP-binding protein [Microvirga flocculans]